MQIEIRELRKEDGETAIRSAIVGMHFQWYFDSDFLLNLYGRYFWYLELTRATQILAAYADGAFAGVLLAKMQGEPPAHRSIWKRLYAGAFLAMQRIFAGKSGGRYEETTEELLAEYRKNHAPDGEILFLAANPELAVRGVGSVLLAELERREPGKEIFLQTDDACTYQFYEHRGFVRACEKKIILDMGRKQVPLHCFLYSKRIPETT